MMGLGGITFVSVTGFTGHFSISPGRGKSLTINIWDIANSDFYLVRDTSSVLTLHKQFPAQKNNYLHTRLNKDD